MFPKIIKAGAGPHDYGSGNNYDETSPELVSAGADSDTGSYNGGDSTASYPSSCEPELELFHVSSVCRPLFLPFSYFQILSSLFRRKKTPSIPSQDTSSK
jgi:hypothetical protein